MGKTAGVITINLTAGTSQFVVQMQKAQAQVRAFGGEATKAHGNFRFAFNGIKDAAEGRVGNALAELTNTLMSLRGTALAVAGGAAGITAIGIAAFEANKHLKEMALAPERIQNAFRGISAPLQLSNDELAVSTDRLNNEIAKLEGHKQNTIKLALDEAKVAADKLADSLERDLSALNKLLSERQVSLLDRILGAEGSKDVTEFFGGKSGLGGYTGRINKITQEGEESITRAQSMPGTDKERLAAADAARAEMNKRLLAEMDSGRAQIAKWRSMKPADLEQEGLTLPSDPAQRNELLAGADVNIARQQAGIRAIDANAAAMRRKEADGAAKANADAIRPYSDKVKELNAQLEEVAIKMQAIGQPEEFQTMAAAASAAVKAITEVDKAIKAKSGSMSKQMKENVDALQTQLVLNTAELDHRTKLQGGTEAIQQRIAETENLTKAIGEGYEATKKANIENRILQELGIKNYNDPSYGKIISERRQQLAPQFEAEHGLQTKTAVDRLTDQIELEKRLTAVQKLGADAVARETLAFNIQQAKKNGASQEQLDLLQQEFDSKRANKSAETLAALTQEIDATRRLSAAQLEGAEAERKEQLAIKYDQMKLNGVDQGNIEATKRKDRLDHQRQITAAAISTGIALYNNLQTVEEEIDIVKSLEILYGKNYITTLSLRNLEKDRLKLMADQLLATGRALDGVRAFFIQIQDKGKTAAQVVNDALNATLDGVSENLAKLITNGKTSFGKMFQDIGRQILTTVLKQGLEASLGKLGGVLGINLGGKKSNKPGTVRDGSTEANALWVEIARRIGAEGVPEGNATPTSGNPQIGDDDGAPGGFGGVIPTGTAADPVWVKLTDQLVQQAQNNGGLFDTLVKPLASAAPALFGGASAGIAVSARAGGGTVSASQAYLVGENGPEILSGVSGRIASNSDSKRMLATAGNTFYTIDARGTDPAQTEARVRQALIAVHGSAISTSIQATQDLQKRIPQK